jgi:hypothetical protein
LTHLALRGLDVTAVQVGHTATGEARRHVDRKAVLFEHEHRGFGHAGKVRFSVAGREQHDFARAACGFERSMAAEPRRKRVAREWRQQKFG